MLSKQIVELMDGFVRVFDNERPASSEFHKAHQTAAARTAQSGFGWSGFSNVMVSDGVGAYLEAKAQFLWEKLQRVVTDTDLEPYPDLATDLKSLIAGHFNPSRKYVETRLEELVNSKKAFPGSLGPMKEKWNNFLPKINAEVDLFCAKYAMDKKRKQQSAGQTVIYNNTVSGSNARVNIDSHDYSINVANSEKIFAELRKAIEANVADKAEVQLLVAKASELQENIGKKTGWKIYQDLVALAANHMSAIGPFIPALTALLPPP